MPDLVPAPLPGLPEKPSDLEGWSSADLTGWVDNAVTVLAAVDRHSERIRLAVGLVLWKLRASLSDGDYGAEIGRIADLAGVSDDSLGRWRTLAEDHYGLGPPPKASKRAEAQRARRTAEREARVTAVCGNPRPIEATAEQVPNADLLVGLDPVGSGAQTVPDPALGGEGPRAAPPVDRPSSAQPGGGSAYAPQEPSAPVSGNAPAVPERPSPFPETPSAGELVAFLLKLPADRLAGVDGPSLRALLALVRAALQVQAAPPAAINTARCPHPKANRKSFGYVTMCELCGEKVS